jgi:hypothetical protein
MKTLNTITRSLPVIALLGTAMALQTSTPAYGQAKEAAQRADAKASTDQKVVVEPAKIDPKKAPKKDGWFPKLTLAATLSMVHTRDVQGIDNGLSMSIGGAVNGELIYRHGQHSWITTLTGMHSWSKTPTVEPFVKASDEANLKSIYEYRFKKVDQLALFAGLQAITSMAPGSIVAAQDVPLVYNLLDGTQILGLAPRNQRVRITKGFNPFIFKQLLGLSARPYKSDLAQLDVKVSLAGQEVWADGFTIADVKTTPEIELAELQDYQQFGLQIEALLGGSIQKNLTYAFRLELMYPFVTSIDTPLSGFDLLNTDITFKLSLKISKWAALEYSFGAKRLPLIVDQWQVTNNLVLSVTANIL